MFANTITLSFGSANLALERINQDSYGSEYRYVSDTQEVTMKIRHSAEGAKGVLPIARHNVFIERTVYATPTAHEKYASMTFTIRDRKGTGPTLAAELAAGAVAFVGSSESIGKLTRGIN